MDSSRCCDKCWPAIRSTIFRLSWYAHTKSIIRSSCMVLTNPQEVFLPRPHILHHVAIEHLQSTMMLLPWPTLLLHDHHPITSIDRVQNQIPIHFCHHRHRIRLLQMVEIVPLRTIDLRPYIMSPQSPEGLHLRSFVCRTMVLRSNRYSLVDLLQ